MGSNNFIALATIPVGAAVGPQASVDLWALVPSSGLQPGFTVICSGDFTGTIAIEGSLDGTNFAPVGSNLQGDSANGFTLGSPAAPVSNSDRYELTPLIVNEAVRYFRTRVAPGTIVRSPITVTVGGSQNLVSGSADWAEDGVRFYAMSTIRGNDSNLGYSDVSGAAAGLVAVATEEKLLSIIPFAGNNRRIAILVEGTGVDPGGLRFSCIYGYRDFVVRGTGDVPSAGAVAFANDEADMIACGAIPAPNSETEGYRCTGVPTVFTSTVVKASNGAAAGLPSEGFSGVTQCRVRFKSNTVTVALRNATSNVWKNTSGQVWFGVAMPVAPAANDEFMIEIPGFSSPRIQFNSVIVSPGKDDHSSINARGIRVAGLRATGDDDGAFAVRGVPCFQGSFIHATGSGTVPMVFNQVGTLRLRQNVETEDFESPKLGCSFRTRGNATMDNIGYLEVRAFGTMGRLTVRGVDSFCQIGAGSSLGTGLRTTGISCQTDVGNALDTNVYAPTRNFAATTGGIFQPGPGVVKYNGIEVENAGGSAHLFTPQAPGADIDIANFINTGGVSRGLALEDVGGSRTRIASTVDFGGATIVIRVGVTGTTLWSVTLTELTYMGVNDIHGNVVYGTAGQAPSFPRLMSISAGAQAARSIMRADGNGTMIAAQANTAANASNVVGICRNAIPGVLEPLGYIDSAGPTLVKLDADATAPGIVYLSEVAAGQGKTTAPATAGTNQILKVGSIMAWFPGTGLAVIDQQRDLIPVLA